MSRSGGVPGGLHDAAHAGTLFVGRAPELASFETQLTRARAGAPAVVVVEGPAGIGKTALVRHALCVADDFQVLMATGDEWESRLDGGIAGRLLAGTDDIVEPGKLRAPQAPGDPFATGVELLELLGQLQRNGSVAIVVDDAQWADTVSVHAVAFAVRRLQRDHVLAVFIARDEPPGLPEVLRRLAEGEHLA